LARATTKMLNRAVKHVEVIPSLAFSGTENVGAVTTRDPMGRRPRADAIQPTWEDG